MGIKWGTKGLAKTLLCMGLLFAAFSVNAAEASAGTTDTQSLLKALWLAVCCAMVLIMQSGFMMLEGGMVRSKNAVNVILKNFTDIGLGTIGYWALGFGLMFGANQSGWIGLSGFFPAPSGTNDSLNVLYQMMFAATAATIMSGAVAERFSFLPYIIGAFFLTSFIYPVYGSWAWGGSGENLGWLRELGFYDAAGATVVHSIGGWCALGALILVGPRTGRFSRKGEVHQISGHSLPYVAFGGFILWFGWFGFNGGSVNDDFSNLGQILLNTHFGAIGGICGAVLWLALTRRGFYMTMIVNGALGGLVSITAGSDVFAPQYALLSGFLGGILVVVSSEVLNRFKIDDVVGAVSVHGFCGAWGTLAVGLFYQGDMFNIERIVAQLVGIVCAFIWASTASFGIFWLLNKVMKIRVSTKMEQRGLDISEHKEIGYNDFVITHVKADK